VANRLHRLQSRGIVNGNIPPLLIDDLHLDPSSSPSASPPLSNMFTIGRYNHRDLILSFILSNLSSVRDMLTLIIVFMLCNMLICHASTLYMLNLVHQFCHVLYSDFNLEIA
jgi:hypothetical protein